MNFTLIEFENDIIEKEHKKIYNEWNNKMIKYMTKISLTLKSINPEERKKKLLDYIKKINASIELNRKKYVKYKSQEIETLNYFHGILIPFSNLGKTKFSSNLVLS